MKYYLLRVVALAVFLSLMAFWIGPAMRKRMERDTWRAINLTASVVVIAFLLKYRSD